MKILHITAYYNDGWGYQENLLPKYQKEMGHEVILITSDKKIDYDSGFQSDVSGQKEYYDGEIKIIRLNSIKIRGSLIFLLGLKDLLRKLKPDLIFHHGIIMPAVISIANYRKNHETKIILDNHTDENILTDSLLAKSTFYKFMKKYIYFNINKFDLFFGVTPERTNFLETFYGLPKEKIRFLPIGIDNLKLNFKETASRDNFNKLSNLREDYDLVLVTGGKLTSEKKTENIIKALKLLNEDYEVLLVIFGKIIDDKLNNLIDKENIIYYEWLEQNEINEIFRICDVGIWVNQHTTLIEDSINANLPLVIPFYGSTFHLINNNAFPLFSGNPYEIYSIVKKIIKFDLLKDIKSETKKTKDLFSYESVAKASIQYLNNEDSEIIDRYNKIMNDYQENHSMINIRR